MAEGEVRKAKETAARVCEHERDNLLYTTESENKNFSHGDECFWIDCEKPMRSTRAVTKPNTYYGVHGNVVEQYKIQGVWFCHAWRENGCA